MKYTLAAFLLIPVVSFSQAPNLLQNAAFDSGGSRYWSVDASVASQGTLSIVSSGLSGAGSALRVTPGSTNPVDSRAANLFGAAQGVAAGPLRGHWLTLS